jgi:SAM-dependent methyltransferase
VSQIQPCVTPGCGSLAVEVLQDLTDPRIPEHPFSFWHCRTCGLGFVSPQPGPDTVDRLYGAYAYHGVPDDTQVRRYRRTLRIARWATNRRKVSGGPNLLGKALEAIARRSLSDSLRVPPSLPCDAAILDFGFGDGSWLSAMRAIGYRRLYGYDLQINAKAREALQRQGITVLEDAATWPSATLDCARLEHVFEHLDTPLEFLVHLRRALRPGGLLVMTMPSIHAWEPVEELPASPHLAYLQLPIHLFHHSLRSARAFLTEAGFQVLHADVLAPYRFLTVAAMRPIADLSSPDAPAT